MQDSAPLDAVSFVRDARRIVVLGTTGSGKSTTAARLSRLLGYPHVELDALNWEPNWTEAPIEIFRERVARATSGDAWVVDGNYSKARDLIWPRASHVIWLKYPLRVSLRQLTWRTFKRSVTGEVLWGTNRERLLTQFFTRESLLLWAFKTRGRHEKTYSQAFQQPEYSHLQVMVLKSPRHTRKWLAEVEDALKMV